MTTYRGHGDVPTKRVLLVDDQNSVRNALYALLESDGYEVLAASNGPDGVAICRQSRRPIDLLVTDCNMPVMSGLELARECSSVCRELSVLYISGARPDEQVEADLGMPRRGFLAKPFRANELLRKARELLIEQSSPLSSPPERFKEAAQLA